MPIIDLSELVLRKKKVEVRKLIEIYKAMVNINAVIYETILLYKEFNLRDKRV